MQDTYSMVKRVYGSVNARWRQFGGLCVLKQPNMTLCVSGSDLQPRSLHTQRSTPAGAGCFKAKSGWPGMGLILPHEDRKETGLSAWAKNGSTAKRAPPPQP